MNRSVSPEGRRGGTLALLSRGRPKGLSLPGLRGAGRAARPYRDEECFGTEGQRLRRLQPCDASAKYPQRSPCSSSRFGTENSVAIGAGAMMSMGGRISATIRLALSPVICLATACTLPEVHVGEASNGTPGFVESAETAGEDAGDSSARLRHTDASLGGAGRESGPSSRFGDAAVSKDSLPAEANTSSAPSVDAGVAPTSEMSAMVVKPLDGGTGASSTSDSSASDAATQPEQQAGSPAEENMDSGNDPPMSSESADGAPRPALTHGPVELTGSTLGVGTASVEQLRKPLNVTASESLDYMLEDAYAVRETPTSGVFLVVLFASNPSHALACFIRGQLELRSAGGEPLTEEPLVTYVAGSAGKSQSVLATSCLAPGERGYFHAQAVEPRGSEVSLFMEAEEVSLTMTSRSEGYARPPFALVASGYTIIGQALSLVFRNVGAEPVPLDTSSGVRYMLLDDGGLPLFVDRFAQPGYVSVAPDEVLTLMQAVRYTGTATRLSVMFEY